MGFTSNTAESRPPLNPKEYLTLKEACAYAACSESTLRRRMKDGKLTPYRNGGGRKLFFHPADLDALFKLDEATEQERMHALARSVAADAPKLSPERKTRLAGLLSL